jgi:aminocarboxymuconate-semialdehyde decarboxylase
LNGHSGVDVHCHFIPPALLDRIAAEGASHSVTLQERGAKQVVDFAGRDQTQVFPKGMLDLEQRLRWMDDNEIEIQVLSAWMDFSAYVLDPADGAWLASSLNELTAEAIARHADRLRAMAAVPLQEPNLAAAELRRAVTDLGMIGVEIATSVVDDELDEDRFDPFWTAAADLSVLVLIHPYASIGAERLERYFFSNVVGNPAEETVAAAHLIFGGVLERHPGLRVCLTHGGGFLPYQIGRQDRGFVARPDVAAVRLTAAPSSFLRRFFYDTIVHSPEALRFLVDRVGSDRVLLGSDYPFPMGDPNPVETVTRADLPPDSIDAIVRRNALEAMGLLDHLRT